MKYLICRRNGSGLSYYHHFDGRHGVCIEKALAPGFTEDDADEILTQLAKVDNRGWEKRECADRTKQIESPLSDNPRNKPVQIELPL